MMFYLKLGKVNKNITSRHINDLVIFIHKNLNCRPVLMLIPNILSLENSVHPDYHNVKVCDGFLQIMMVIGMQCSR